MSRRPFVIAAALALTAALAPAGAPLRAEEGSLRFEKTVPFERGELIQLGAKVGPVRVGSVRIDLGSGGGGGIAGTIRSRMPGAGDPEVSTTVRASFDNENPSEDEWVVTYTLDFLDRDGKLIDRATAKKGFEGEAATYTVEHSTLQYVVPFIARVKIQLEARYD
jgi:hypothetical protein